MHFSTCCCVFLIPRHKQEHRPHAECQILQAIVVSTDRQSGEPAITTLLIAQMTAIIKIRKKGQVLSFTEFCQKREKKNMKTTEGKVGTIVSKNSSFLFCP